MRLTDTLSSRRHARVFLAPGSAEILDLSSTDGLRLNGEPVVRRSWLQGDQLRLGDTVLRIEFTAPAPDAAHASASAFNRSPVVTPAFAGITLEAPELPDATSRPRFPVLPMLAPVAIGGVLYAVTRDAATLLFVAFSPMMLLANLVEGRWASARGSRGSMAALRRELAALDATAATARTDERRARNAEHPATANCLAAAAQRSPLLWSRRPEAPRFLDLRVGAATRPSRLRFHRPPGRRAVPEAVTALDELTARYLTVDDVPFALSLTALGSVGVTGEPGASADVTRAIACQLAALHSPAEVVFAAFCGVRWKRDWDWLKWLPHVSSAHSPIEGPHLVTDAESAALLGQLEELAQAREGSGSRVAVVVFIDSGTKADRARLVELSRTGPGGRDLLRLAGGARREPACYSRGLRRGPRRPHRQRGRHLDRGNHQRHRG